MNPPVLTNLKVRVEPDALASRLGAVGIWVEGLLQVKIGSDEHNEHFVLVPIRSPGLWDVDSPDQDYIYRIAREEVDSLSQVLHGLKNLDLLQALSDLTAWGDAL